MFPIHPPDDPFLINTYIFGLPIQVRWYGVLIVTGALLAGWLAARRAQRRGYNPDHVWNLLMLGMILGILGARAYYVAFEWERFAGRPLLEIINPAGGGGGLAIHGALIGAIAAALIYTRRHQLPFVEWLDICMPAFLLAQAVGRWGNFFNQEAYGRPTSLPFGVTIDLNRRLPPYQNLPENTLFHATFLYESVWNLSGVALMLWLERRLRGRLRTGDMALLYAVIYGIGRFWIEGLRTDSLCTSGVGGECEGALRMAQVVSLVLVAVGLVGLYLNHRRAPWASEIRAAADAEPTAGTAAETTSGESAPSQSASTTVADSNEEETLRKPRPSAAER